MPQKNKIIYLDNAATTPLDPMVKKAMDPFFSTHFANASALYPGAQIVQKAIVDARKSVAFNLHALPDNIIFTSGGTESNNLAIFGICNSPLGRGRGGLVQGRHIITTPIEHESVLKPLEVLIKQGWQVTYLPVDEFGFVKPSDVLAAITPQTVLVSVMYANNEIGTIEPIAEIGKTILRYRKEHNSFYPYFHTDACQAANYLSLDVEKLHVDLMTLNGGKIYGPKGSGCLYVRRGVPIHPTQQGGSQERGLRGGTENVPGIIGFAKALEIAQKQRNKEIVRQQKLTEYFFHKLITNVKLRGNHVALRNKLITNNSLNGPTMGETRLPNNLNVQFEGVDGEAFVIYLGEQSICCSTSSACTVLTSTPSHVLQALHMDEQAISNSVRFSIGRNTTKSSVDAALKAIKRVLAVLKVQP